MGSVNGRASLRLLKGGERGGVIPHGVIPRLAFYADIATVGT